MLVVGDDPRQEVVAGIFARKGMDVQRSTGKNTHESILGMARSADIIVLPLPCSRDAVHLIDTDLPLSLICVAGSRAKIFGGVVPQSLSEKYGVTDYYTYEPLLAENAEITAECAIGIAIEKLPITLKGSKIAVLGGGRIARGLIRRLIALGAAVSCFARSEEQQQDAMRHGATAHSMDRLLTKDNYHLIMNTIPAPILKGTEKICRGDVYYMELASLPGGLEKPEIFGTRYIAALSLPGKMAPKSAAAAVARAVETLSKRGEANG